MPDSIEFFTEQIFEANSFKEIDYLADIMEFEQTLNAYYKRDGVFQIEDY